MPPKAKFSKEEIIAAGLDIVRKEGFSALTARGLGARLGSSARPVFTVFDSMEEVQQSVVGAARDLYGEHIERGLSENPAFKGVGTQYILFAVKEPRLFRLLFMSGQKDVPNLDGVLPQIDDNYEKILASVRDGYSLGGDAAEWLYRHLWIYTHGIAALCATGMCRFTGEEISVMMTEVLLSLLERKRKEGEKE